MKVNQSATNLVTLAGTQLFVLDDARNRSGRLDVNEASDADVYDVVGTQGSRFSLSVLRDSDNPVQCRVADDHTGVGADHVDDESNHSTVAEHRHVD